VKTRFAIPQSSGFKLTGDFLLMFVRDSAGPREGQRRLAKRTDHNSDRLSGGLESDNTGGVLSGLLADEDELDRRALWRLGSWARSSPSSPP
jgi:hypothetical protein